VTAGIANARTCTKVQVGANQQWEWNSGPIRKPRIK